MLVAGVIFTVLGLLLSMTVIGAIIGIPLMIVGGICMTAGIFTRRRTVIQNVVTVQNAPPTNAPDPKTHD